MGARRLKPEGVAAAAAAKAFDRQARADPVVRALMEHLFEMENRVRKLEGKAPVNRAAVRAAFRTKVTG